METEYSASALSHEIPGELKRLRALEGAVDPFSKECLEFAGVSRVKRCLEIGAGAGSIAYWLAQRRHDITVVATELDLRFLSEGPNVQVIEHDIRTDGFSDASFELIHVRAVLSHLPERETIISHAWRWLSPGGILCVEDIDVSVVDSSPNPELTDALYALESILARTLGSDLRWARTLPAALDQAGFEAVNFRALPLTVGNHSPTERFISTSFEQFRATFATVEPRIALVVDTALRAFAKPSFGDLAGLFIAAWGSRPQGAVL